MSLKNDIEMVKDELNSEEKFFEKAVITEKFVKKYKNLMIGSVIAVTLFVTASIVYNQMQSARIDDANVVFSQLQAGDSSLETLAKLKSLSPDLHDVWVYSQAIATKNSSELEKLENSKAAFVGDLSSYEVAQNTKDVSKLEKYAQKQNAVYADLAIVQAAVILMDKGDVEKAHAKLKMISTESPLFEVASTLMHYGVK